MTVAITPPIGGKGIYTLAPPFASLVDTGVEYTCQAVRRLSDYIASNEKPKELIYTTYGIEDQFDADLSNDVYIVSLQSRRGHWLYVPEQYVLAFPSGSGHRYRALSLVFALPSLPVTTDLQSIQDEVSQLIKARLGIDVKSKPVETSQVTLVSDERHIEISTARELAKTANGNWEELSHLRFHNQELRTKLAALELYIKSLQ